jgi:hypothetical protein
MLLSRGRFAYQLCALRELFREETELVTPSGAAPPD